ncbi:MULTISPECIES: response regulator transcription factor [Pseudomonas syringae group]|uniref:Transcriptional regulator n=1 Tax=Pseudomonas syringae pv. persicae TaxID=237306 RepID=A0AB38EPM3_9PSED|nr:helix-turn-helix transcriptional regulator [Pseudomonas syringae group genomosp. 3]SOQ16437.1 putative transcriptional regulator [Pseudomonas syringae pv. persicae]SOQ16473.1 putative transcriptional regulator [Pseudomonas syringae pv. persicae]
MTTLTITFAGFTGFLGRGAAPRELECLMAVASGMTSKEAARDLGIAAGTIDKRLLALTTKLGVTRRAALVAEAFKRGLISPAAALAILLATHGALAYDPLMKVRRSGGGESKIETRIAARRVEISLAA